MNFDPTALDDTLATARQRLLACRAEAGHWVGELSTSALSTATAVFALHMVQQRTGSAQNSPYEELIRRGLRWLVEHQNADGGWGDTIRSLSNISTTALGWAALAIGGDDVQDAAARAEQWLKNAAGSLEPAALAQAIAKRYGKDRTFSVPILTMCALAGRLGEQAWRLVPQLPFELAACPHQWFKFLRLPVVSYALPALIAIGRVRHCQRPSWNPLARLVRYLAAGRSMRVLEEIQPQGGGFLEATPLTSFVVMSLAGANLAEHAVTRRGVEFLVRSVRPDGSWPIDTNLATWVTTLSVNALAPGGLDELAIEERQRICDWLLKQQYRHEHPYTHADPGGWAWTDLPGGVPDADDTAGAILALHHLAPGDARVRQAASAGIRWLLALQNRDGGVPTFCRGWGALPFDRSGQDLTAHALLAWSVWRQRVAPDLAALIETALARGVDYLARCQRADGSFLPLWFGNQFAPEDENPTYGTARVLIALHALDERQHVRLKPMKDRARQWLISVQNPDGGWGGAGGVASSIEETALAVHALASATGGDANAAEDSALARGVRWLIDHTDQGRHFEPAPIGFYFAKLWYFESLYPLIFTVAGLSRAKASRCPGRLGIQCGA